MIIRFEDNEELKVYRIFGFEFLESAQALHLPDYYAGPGIWSCSCSQMFWSMNLLLDGL